MVGTAFGSLALVGDAVHNLGDVAGLALGWGAERLSTRPPNERFTYGFGRSTQLAALSNGVLVAMASAVVVVEAIQRLHSPQPLVSGPVAWAAAAISLVSATAQSVMARFRGPECRAMKGSIRCSMNWPMAAAGRPCLTG